jgi:hypothetical protein
LKKGVFRAQWFRFRSFPNCSALSPPSLPRPSTLVLLSLSPPRLPWLRWFITTRPRWRSTQCVACLDGARQCLLGGSGPALPPRRSRHREVCALRSLSLLRVGAADFAVLPTAVGGVQPHGGWHPSTIIRLQGFSSCSPVATSGLWSSTRMTTSLVVERSEPGCKLPPLLSFKDVHHPCWGGGQAEWELRLPRGLAVRFFLQHSGEKGVRQPCGGGELRVCGADRLWRRQLPRVWLPGLGGSGAASCCLGGAWSPVHRTGDGRTVHGSATSTASPAPPAAPGGRTRHRTPRGRRQHSWRVLSSLSQ